MDESYPAGQAIWPTPMLTIAMADYHETNETDILARAVRERRKSLGMTQGQLARLAGLDLSYVNDIEQARANPTLTVLIRLSRVLSISVSDLLR